MAQPVSNAPCDGEVSEGWSQCDRSAWLPASTLTGPGASEPIDSSLTTGSCTTIDDDLVIDRIDMSEPIDSSVTTTGSATIDSASSASHAEAPTITSVDHGNLQTEPNFRPEREPNNPDLALDRKHPGDHDVPRAELERHHADAAGGQADPNRRLISATVLGVSAVLLLYVLQSVRRMCRPPDAAGSRGSVCRQGGHVQPHTNPTRQF